MQAYVLVGPIYINGYASALGFSSTLTDSHRWNFSHHLHPASRTRRSRFTPEVHDSSFSSSSSSPSINGQKNHYEVLGLPRSATSKDIKRAYRLLARQYHPDVCKNSQAGDFFKSIHCAYEVLSNEVTRNQYDQALKFQEFARSTNNGKWVYSSEIEDGERIYRWAELRRKVRQDRSWKYHKTSEESDEDKEEEASYEERGSFGEVVRSVFLSLFLMQTFGSQLALTLSSLMALFDRKLDGGYKLGYVIAWVMGGRGGVLLTFCLSFASFVCGKTSSSVIALVVVAMWVGSNLGRYAAPFPQGALLTLLYMSIKLQTSRYQLEISTILSLLHEWYM